MAEPLVIAGAGGFGREVLDVVRAANHSGGADFEFLGFLDDSEPDKELLGRISARWLGPVDAATELAAGARYLIGIGSPVSRRLISERLDECGLQAATVMHPQATVGGDVVTDSGTVICSHVSLTTNIRMGRHVHVNLNATVGHDCDFGDFVTINPGANVSGNVTLADDVTIGTGACVIQGVRVGARSTVGAGAAVIRDVEPSTVVKGVPAKP